MWSNPLNSMNAIPFDLVGSSFCVRWRIDLGLIEAKCLVIDSVVALNGMLPSNRKYTSQNPKEGEDIPANTINLSAFSVPSFAAAFS